MSIAVVCPGCRADFNLKNEFGGRKVRCPTCESVIDVPMAAQDELAGSFTSASSPDLDPVFHRDKFLFRQKHFSINQKYLVWDESGQPIMFIERPTHFFRTLLATLMTVGVAVVLLIVFVALGMSVKDRLGEEVTIGVIFSGLVVTVAVAFMTMIRFIPKRHIHFYRDETKQARLLDILQDQKLVLFVATYTVKLPDESVLGTFRKNYLYNIYRKRWDGFDADGNRQLIAQEDSLLLSLLRRFLGPLFGILRTNFVICGATAEGRPGEVLGEFNRKYTLFDRYALDMSADRARSVDRRVAVALGVLLDTGEQR